MGAPGSLFQKDPLLMQVTRLLAAASVAALIAAPAFAQAPAAPAATPEAAAAPVAQVTPSLTIAAQGDTIETLKAAGQFTTLLKALDATNLTGVIKAQKTLTVFAPTDAAFAALPAGELDKLMTDAPALQQVLTYHLINSPIDKAKIAGAKGPIPTVAGTGLVLDGSAADGSLKANDANILTTDVKTTSGVLYAVDKVLTPAGAAAVSQPAPADAAAPAS